MIWFPIAWIALLSAFTQPTCSFTFLSLVGAFSSPLEFFTESESVRLMQPQWVGQDLGKGPATKTDEFSEKFQTAFDPAPSPLSFSENCVANFCNFVMTDMDARRYDGQIV